MNLRRCVWLLAALLGSGISASTASAASTLHQDDSRDRSHEQAHDQDYSKNKNYQQGMRDGRDDRAHNRDHSKKRHFKKDDDRRAYESGYDEGHRGDQTDRH
jgi:polynucleotide 5'-kinase involved in rRNA processing